MLQSTFELIGLASSNSHVIFCLFNLIIAVLVVGSSKSNHQNHKLVSSVVDHESRDHKSVSLPEKATAEMAEVAGADEDDEDLKTRVEEFIQKMNKEWMDDKVRTYSSIDQSHVFSRF